MNDEEKQPERKKKSSDLLGMLTGRIGKTTALLLALTGLIGAAENFFEISSRVLEIFEAEKKTCFQARMSYPKTVSVNGWQSMSLRLSGTNDCRERLGVHIAFKAKRLNKVIIGSPVSTCVDPVDPSCWEVKYIEAGAVDAKFLAPHLEVLKKPLGDPIDLNINWVVYNVENRKRLDADAVQIQLTDDL